MKQTRFTCRPRLSPGATQSRSPVTGHTQRTLSVSSNSTSNIASQDNSLTVLHIITVSPRRDWLETRIHFTVRATVPGECLRWCTVSRARVPGVRRERVDLRRRQSGDRLARTQTGCRLSRRGRHGTQEGCAEREGVHDCRSIPEIESGDRKSQDGARAPEGPRRPDYIREKQTTS